MVSLLIVCGLLIIVVLLAVRERKRFNEQFPPISDAEFMARCKPGTNPDVALKVRRIVSEHLAVEYARVYPESNFIEDFGVD